MWLTKPIYETLPYAYFVAGGVSLISSMYVDYWHWPIICTVTGLVCLTGGLVVWLRRRDYRSSRSRKLEITEELTDSAES